MTIELGIKIGDALYLRVASDWEIWIVVGQTPGTWMLEYKPTGALRSVNKTTLLSAKDSTDGMRSQFYTMKQKGHREFCDKHASDIATAVSVCADADKLVQIAKLVGKVL